ncbi:MAG: hypothetical protein AB8F65_13035 [Woeseiaceae bacterium]
MRRFGLLVLCLWVTGCGNTEPESVEPVAKQISLDALAREYVVLELAMGEIDSNHVDAYSGPEDLRTQAAALAWTLDDIDRRAADLKLRLNNASIGDASRLRIDALLERLTALEMRVAINQEQFVSFDEEAKALFGAAAPDYDADHFDSILAEIAALLPGDEPLPVRVDAFKSQFDVPADKVDAVFVAAMAACREKTLAYVDLPANESFTIEYVNDKPWSGYNWYKGDAHSLIQVNTDFPLAISRAVDLGCHEGYPGHHTFNALLEREMLKGKGWIEYSLYPLFSPQSLIAEGSGNYGIELAFPGDERVQFEQEVLFPLAGLDATQADQYYQLLELLQGLSYAGNEAARDYLNGDITRDEAIEFLVKYSLSEPERAAQRVRFFDTYRSYVINYNLGKDLVAAHVERGDADQDLRWARFVEMLSTPTSASDLER